MNALKVLFIIAFTLYMLYYEPTFWKYYLGILIPYYLFTQLFFYNSKYNSLKKKVFIAMWCSPYDPQILGSMEINVNKIKDFMEEYSKKVGYKVGLTIFLTKLSGLLLKKFKQINGNVVFGKFIPRDTIDISVISKVNSSQSNSELITVKNVDKLSFEDISKEIKRKVKLIEDGQDSYHNRLHFIAKILPSFLLTPVYRAGMFLSNCGLPLGIFGFPRYQFGSIIISPNKDYNIENAFLPIPPQTYAPVLFTFNPIKERKTEENKIENILRVGITIDHRYLDGSLAAKMSNYIQTIVDDPSLIIDEAQRLDEVKKVENK